ncbi:MAG TPA: hypothetical protein VGQ62_22840 [Chloroflexota bacterium]|nr:hypothetical protein [Chloroflexota bacterium]
MTSSQTPIHATNAWNPTGRNLQPLPGTRLYFTHADALSGPRTFVLLGDQHHLTFVGDLPEHVAPAELRSIVLAQFGLYPHLVDLNLAPGLPHPVADNPRQR